MNTRSKLTKNKMAEDELSEVDDVVKCKICELIVIDNPSKYEEMSIECECCLHWFHLNCSGLEKEKYEAIDKFKLHWFCGNCDQGASSLYLHCTTLRAENKTMKNDILQLKTRISKCEQENDKVTEKITVEINQLNSKLNQEIDNKVASEMTSLKAKLEQYDQTYENWKEQLKQELINELKTEVSLNPQEHQPATYAEAAAEAAREAYRQEIAATRETVTREMEIPTRTFVRQEMEENLRIQQRKNNIVVLNLEDAEHITAEDDISRITEIVHERLQLPGIQITNAKRLGTYDAEKKRPVRVIFNTLDDKKKILSRAINMRELPDDDEYCRVYIRPDLTQAQLRDSKNLYTELTNKREQFKNKLWKIYRGKVVEAELRRGRLVAIEPEEDL